jgi:diguanylate cyclase (GGDEF)-like protein
MIFDVSTLSFSGGAVAFASGLVLLMTWWNDRSAWPAFWWASASLGVGTGVTMLALRDVLPSYTSNIVGPAIIDLGAALTFVAARIFNRRAARPFPVLAGVAIWIAILVITGSNGHVQFAVAVGAGISGCLYAAAATEFWLARDEELRARWPMIAILGLEAIALSMVAAGFFSTAPSLPLPLINWFGIIHFVGLAYSGGSAIFLIMMLNERSEAKHKAAALVDPLTGLSNRRAFVADAQLLFDRSGQEGIPISLLAFDLDRFKGVNDTFGHPVGDQVLRIFADVLLRALRPADIAGRIGGEEFSAALPGCSAEVALAVARRIRSAFEDDARFVGGQHVGATVSVGVATATVHTNLAQVIANADGALYRAKGLGRNRVSLARGNSFESEPSIVVRIA